MELLHWTLILLVVALIFGALGFGGFAAAFASVAKILFFVFVVLFIISLFYGRGRGTRL